MENYTLRTAFPNAQCSDVLANARVLNISADVKKRSIRLAASCDDAVQYADVENFIKAVKESYQLLDFEADITFNAEDLAENECAVYCIDEICAQNPLWRAVLDSCIVEAASDTITVFLRHGNRDLAENEGIDKEIAALLESRFGLRCKITFDVDEMTVEKTLAPLSMPKEAPAPKRLVSVAAEGALIGKPFTVNDLIDIKEIDNYTGNCMICGDIFGIDCREIAKIKKRISPLYTLINTIF